MAVVFAQDAGDTSLDTSGKCLADIQYSDLIVIAVGAWKQLCPIYDELPSIIRNGSES